jgi:hypothetical protein
LDERCDNLGVRSRHVGRMTKAWLNRATYRPMMTEGLALIRALHAVGRLSQHKE